MRADRLISILMTLQLRGRVTASELAVELEVSARTIFRDVDALGHAGVPIYTERGRAGGLRLMDGYRTDLTGLSSVEAAALPFAGLGPAAEALGLGVPAAAARLKVRAALTNAGRERALRTEECFHLDPADWYRRSARPKHLTDVATAAWSRRAIEIDYESWQSRQLRVVEPFGLVLKAGQWYLVARFKQAMRIYRVEGIQSVRMLEREVVRPRNFSLARVWSAEVSRFEASLRKAKAEILVAPDALSRANRLGAEAAEAIFAATPDSSGNRHVTIWIEGTAHAASLLLGFGTGMEVLAPPALRAEVAARAAGLVALYAKAPQAGNAAGTA